MSDKPDKPDFLICAEADVEFVAKGSKFDRFCSRCHRAVALAPSGQRLLQQQPELAILCFPCYLQDKEARAEEVQLSSSPQEIAEEIKSAVPNLRRNRN